VGQKTNVLTHGGQAALTTGGNSTLDVKNVIASGVVRNVMHTASFTLPFFAFSISFGYAVGT